MWYNCTVTATRKLRISYNNSLRRLLNILKHNSVSDLFVNLNFKSLGEFLKKHSQVYEQTTVFKEFTIVFYM